jgi:hypothetical protein
MSAKTRQVGELDLIVEPLLVRDSFACEAPLPAEARRDAVHWHRGPNARHLISWLSSLMRPSMRSGRASPSTLSRRPSALRVASSRAGSPDGERARPWDEADDVCRTAIDGWPIRSGRTSFRRLVWLLPIAFALREAEEWNLLAWHPAEPS